MLFTFNLNHNWARRFSALFYPKYSCEFKYSEPKYEIVMNTTAKTYEKVHRFPKKVNEIELDFGEELNSNFQKNFFKVNGKTLEVYKTNGGEKINSFDLSVCEILVVLNEMDKKSLLSQHYMIIKNPKVFYVMKSSTVSELESWCRTLTTMSPSIIVKKKKN